MLSHWRFILSCSLSTFKAFKGPCCQALLQAEEERLHLSARHSPIGTPVIEGIQYLNKAAPLSIEVTCCSVIETFPPVLLGYGGHWSLGHGS